MYRRTVLRASATALGLSTASSTTTARQDGYGPIGTVPLTRPGAVDLSDDGETAYVANSDGRGGFTVVDVSDPTTPTVIASKRPVLTGEETEPASSVDLSVSGDRLLVGGPKFAVPGMTWGVVLYDVSVPSDPKRLATRETDHAIHNLTLAGETAYLTGTGLEEGPVVVVDVAGDEFEELTRWSIVDADERWADVSRLARSCHDVTVRGDTAYAPHLDGGTWLLDVSDPSAPEPMGHVGPSVETVREAIADSREAALTELPGNAHSAVPGEDGSVLAVANEAFDHELTPEQRGPGGVVLWDVSDPSDPTELSRIAPPPVSDPTTDGHWVTAHNVDVVDGRLYSGWLQGGVMLHGVSDPANPRRLAWWRDPDRGAFWAARSAVHGEFFVAPSTGRNGSRTALFAFPDEPGEQEDPPALRTTTTERRTTTRSPTTTSAATATSAATTDEEAETTSGATTGSTAGNVSGFGVGAALAGLGAGALLAGRRSE